jgi:hypothetical protein
MVAQAAPHRWEGLASRPSLTSHGCRWRLCESKCGDGASSLYLADNWTQADTLITNERAWLTIVIQTETETLLPS